MKNYRAELVGVFGDPVDGNPTGVTMEAAFEEKPCAGATGEADFYTVSLGDAGREGCLMEVLFSEG